MKLTSFLLMLVAGLAPVTSAMAQSYCFKFNSTKKSDAGIAITPDSVYSNNRSFGYDLLPAPEAKSNQPFFFSVNVLWIILACGCIGGIQVWINMRRAGKGGSV